MEKGSRAGGFQNLGTVVPRTASEGGWQQSECRPEELRGGGDCVKRETKGRGRKRQEVRPENRSWTAP